MANGDWHLPPALAEARRPKPGHPLVHLSYAQSLDGRIATRSGDSRGLSSPESLLLTHMIRAESDTILVGIGTVLADDPMLDCRLPSGCPAPALRVVLDSGLRLPLDCRLVRTAQNQPVLVYCLPEAMHGSDKQAHIRALMDEGVMIAMLAASGTGKIDPGQVLMDLGRRGCHIVFVEGGSQIITAFTAGDLIDLVTVFLSPRLIGSGIEAFGELHVNMLAAARKLIPLWSRECGTDLVWRLRPDQTG